MYLEARLRRIRVKGAFEFFDEKNVPTNLKMAFECACFHAENGMFMMRMSVKLQVSSPESPDKSRLVSPDVRDQRSEIIGACPEIKDHSSLAKRDFQNLSWESRKM